MHTHAIAYKPYISQAMVSSQCAPGAIRFGADDGSQRQRRLNQRRSSHYRFNYCRLIV